MTQLVQPSIDDLMAPTRTTDPETSHMAAMGVNVRQKQRLALQALSALKRSNPQPVEAWRVRRKAQAINERLHPKSKPLGESTIRTRLNELTRLELVDCVDHFGTTESGGRCSRYQITRKGQDALKEES